MGKGQKNEGGSDGYFLRVRRWVKRKDRVNGTVELLVLPEAL